MIFNELLQYCKAKAIADSLLPTEDSIWRSACRYYSKRFNTPLSQVIRMDPEHILLTNFEDQLSEIDIEENIDSILEQIYRMENPNYEKEEEDDVQEFIKKVENMEAKKANNKKELSEKTLLKKEEKEKESKPTEGSVDFSHLNDEY